MKKLKKKTNPNIVNRGKKTYEGILKLQLLSRMMSI